MIQICSGAFSDLKTNSAFKKVTLEIVIHLQSDLSLSFTCVMKIGKASPFSVKTYTVQLSKGSGSASFKISHCFIYNNVECLRRSCKEEYRFLELELTKRGIPYILVRGITLLKLKEWMDVIALLRLVVNPQDDAAFERMYNTPKRKLG
jgi:hypothetical protein